MLWRTLQSPWRLGNQNLPRSIYLSTSLRTSLLPTRLSSHIVCIRGVHNPTSAEDAEPSATFVHHARLLYGPGKRDKLRLDGLMRVAGLVRSIRKQKSVAFARIGDGSTLANVQAVFPDPQLAKEYVDSSITCSASL